MANPRSNVETEGSQPKYNIKVEKDVPITMPDGVRLFADIYRPDAEGRFPGKPWSVLSARTAKATASL